MLTPRGTTIFLGKTGLANGLLALVLALLALAPTQAMAADGDGALVRPEGAVRQLESMKTERSTTWLTESGQQVTNVGLDPVRWQDAAGDWHAFDFALRERGEGKELGPEPWALDGKPIEVRLPVVLDEKAEGKGLSTLTAGEAWLKTEIVGAQSRAETKGEHAIYADALPGVNVDLSAIPSGLKETLTLADPKAASDFSYVISLSDGLVPEIDSRTGMIVVEGPTRAVFTIPRPSVADAKDNVGPSPRYSLEELGSGRWSLKYSVDREWLEDAGRAWPVVVDPTTGVVTSNAAATLMCPWGGHEHDGLQQPQRRRLHGRPISAGRQSGHPAADRGADVPARQRRHRLGASEALSDVHHELVDRPRHHGDRQHRDLDEHGADPPRASGEYKPGSAREVRCANGLCRLAGHQSVDVGRSFTMSSTTSFSCVIPVEYLAVSTIAPNTTMTSCPR